MSFASTQSRRWFLLNFTFCFWLAFLSASLWGQQDFNNSALATEPQQLVLPEAEEEFGAAEWRPALRILAQPGVRTELVNYLRYEAQEFPRLAFVENLQHPELAIRLGALEILEDFAGGTFEFNPWLGVGNAGNADALKSWQLWAQQKGELAFGEGGLNEEQLEIYLRSLFSEKPEEVDRALRMLETDRLTSLRAVMQSLEDPNNILSTQQRASLTRAKYQLVLSLVLQDTAPRVARELSMGSRDQQINGLTALRSAGMGGIPVAREFLNSQDALVRESAIETLLKLAGTEAVEWVAPVILEEQDVNVIHTTLRLLSDIQEQELQLEFLQHPDEDIVITVLENLASSEGGASMSFNSEIVLSSELQSALLDEGFSQEDIEALGLDDGANGAGEGEEEGEASSEQSKRKTVAEQVMDYLGDPRWRVRVAALNYVNSKNLRSAADQVIELIGDEDAFVRARALQAASRIAKDRVAPRVEELLEQNPTWFEEMARGLSEADLPFPEKMSSQLGSLGVDELIGVINGMGLSDQEVLIEFAGSENLDIACAALRRLSSECSRNEIARGVMVVALRSGREEKIQAIVETLSFPRPDISDPRLMQLPEGVELISEGDSELDGVYEALLTPYRERQSQDTGVFVRPGEGEWQVVQDALAEYFQEISPDNALAFQAARLLLRPNDERAFAYFGKHYDELTLAQRLKVADQAYLFQTADALPLARRMLRDADSGVRSEVADGLLNQEDLPAVLAEVFSQLGNEDSPLRGSEVYGSYFEGLFREMRSNNQVRKLVQSWAIKTLEGGAEDEQKVLALLAVERGENPQDVEAVEPYLRSSNPWLRRMAVAAYQAVGEELLLADWQRFANDENWRVREALAMSFLPDSSDWEYWFDNETSVSSRHYSFYSSGSSGRLSSQQQVVLNYLIEQDGRAEVRFEASMAMLEGGGSLDMSRFLNLLEVVPKERQAGKRLTQFVRTNYQRLSVDFRALLNRINLSDLDEDDRGKIVSHFSGSPQTGIIASFDELIQVEQETAEVKEVAAAVVEPEPRDSSEAPEQIKILYFYQVGCDKCDRAEMMLEDLKEELPQLNIEKYNINENSALNRAISARLNLNVGGKTPAIFTQEGGIVDREINSQTLAALIQETLSAPVRSDWADITQEEVEQAQQEIADELAGMSWWKVFSAGLLDGLNPCAFATIIFFLSWLQVSRRSPGEILAVGLAFVFAVFITYLSLGLLLYQLLEILREQIAWASRAMNFFFAVFVLILAFLSFRDAWKAKQGKMEEMTLQLPGMMKEGIKKVVRKSAKRGFLLSAILAAFVAGIIISFLELACTGQVYIPIINGIINGDERALSLMIIFNVGFIIPLLIVFILAFFGMTSQDLIAFQQKYTTPVKIALGLLFLLMFAYLLQYLL